MFSMKHCCSYMKRQTFRMLEGINRARNTIKFSKKKERKRSARVLTFNSIDKIESKQLRSILSRHSIDLLDIFGNTDISTNMQILFVSSQNRHQNCISVTFLNTVKKGEKRICLLI